MSIQHIALVLETSGLRPQEKAVLTAFCNHTDPSGKTFAGEERLMREAGMPRTTFQRWRSDLVDRSLLLSKRKGRPGGGRTTSDTWVNLAMLRSMRDAFFNKTGTDRPEDENPFSQVESNGSTDGVEGGGNGSVSGAIKSSTDGATTAPLVEPVTLNNPQREPHTPRARASNDDEEPETLTGVCANTPQNNDKPTNDVDVSGLALAAANLLRRIVPTSVAERMTGAERQHLAATVAEAINQGWVSHLIEPKLRGAVDDQTRKPFAVLARRLAEIIAEQAPRGQSEARGSLWGDSGSDVTSGDAEVPVEAALGVLVDENGKRRLVPGYRSCQDRRHCTGGNGSGISGARFRYQIDEVTGILTVPCANTVTLPDGRKTTCHPDAKR